MKQTLIVIFLLISVCTCYAQKTMKPEPNITRQARVQEYFPRFDDKIDACRFSCSRKDSVPGVFFAEIELLGNDTLQIINHTAISLTSGISIKILLDSNLKVTSIIYSEWSEDKDRYERTYSVESPSVLLNFNPFQKGITGLQGRYNFIIRTDYVPAEKLRNKGETESTDYRMFYGRFKCD